MGGVSPCAGQAAFARHPAGSTFCVGDRSSTSRLDPARRGPKPGKKRGFWTRFGPRRQRWRAGPTRRPKKSGRKAAAVQHLHKMAGCSRNAGRSLLVPLRTSRQRPEFRVLNGTHRQSRRSQVCPKRAPLRARGEGWAWCAAACRQQVRWACPRAPAPRMALVGMGTCRGRARVRPSARLAPCSCQA
ncbi:MAG: hypothetical protein QOJ57_2258 [Thermoleophilaceae bacterium]|jgi:hypothetical protein|nr:hypothetical protein [Thermoleophilaceae bacterium]